MKTKQSPLLRVAALLFSFVLVFSLGAVPRPSAANTLDELNDKYNKLEDQIALRQKKLQQTQSSIASNESKLETLQAQVEDIEAQVAIINEKRDLLQAQITPLDNSIAKLDREIADCNQQITQMQQDIDRRYAEMEETTQQLLVRMRASYMSGNVSWLELLLQAEDMSSFLIRSEMLRRVAVQDEELIDTLEKETAKIEGLQADMEKTRQTVQAKRTEVDAQRAELLNKKKELDNNAALLAAKQKDINNKYSQIDQLLEKLDANNAAYQKEVAKLQQEREALEREIQNYIKDHGSSAGDDDQDYTNSGKMMCPVPYSQAYISSGYGTRTLNGSTSFHGALDICVYPNSQGKKIVAAQGGKVILAQTNNNSSYGLYIIIDHGNGLHTLYAHCESLRVYTGQVVKKGDHIGIIGNTGRVTGRHLHFEVQIRNGSSVTRVNPLNYISVP